MFTSIQEIRKAQKFTPIIKSFIFTRMKKWILSILSLVVVFAAVAQSEDVAVLHENAKKFMKQGDYANATVILVRAMDQAPYNIAIAKDLALSYYMQNDNTKALNALRHFLDKNNADPQTYQIAGMIYKRTGQVKDAEKIYKKALKSFPDSGPLYNDYGELLWSTQDYSAINLWENGIKAEPSFPGNYYNAARYYYLSKDKIWSIIYGEIFINIESYSSRTAEMKNILLDSYKKLFSTPDLLADTKGKSKFEIAFLTAMNKQNSIVVRGINAETLTMIRTRFILNWYKDYAARFPFYLFDMQKNMLENGLFQAYNQWIFGASQNLSAYQHWISTHDEEYKEFLEYLKDRRFAISGEQYYH